jgi:pyruvate/2-oxoglutarate dehydrogenase complex dihydrolipoamide dehydrogenase (E3) component
MQMSATPKAENFSFLTGIIYAVHFRIPGLPHADPCWQTPNAEHNTSHSASRDNCQMKPHYSKIGIVGAGAMGRGIAQIAAQAGSQVLLFDVQKGAADTARVHINDQWKRLCDKQRITVDEAQVNASRLGTAQALSELADCDLVIEAVVERI